MILLSTCKLKKNIRLFLFFFILVSVSLKTFSQVHKNEKVSFIWTDISLKPQLKPSIYIVYNIHSSTDTIFPSKWDPSLSDTIVFDISAFKNPVYLELSTKSFKKQSNKFNLIPTLSYNLTEFDDKIEVKPLSLIFDSLDSKSRSLYSFLVKLIIELLIAIPVAALFRLPVRLYFFVFVANIMSFPLTYVTFIPAEIKEILTIVLEGLFIYVIGWKRLKFSRALLVSLILNVVRFGIAKIVMLLIRII